MDQIFLSPHYLGAPVYDIALLKLSSSVTYTKYIQPICVMASISEFENRSDCWVTGWGDVEEELSESGDRRVWARRGWQCHRLLVLAAPASCWQPAQCSLDAGSPPLPLARRAGLSVCTLSSPSLPEIVSQKPERKAQASTLSLLGVCWVLWGKWVSVFQETLLSTPAGCSPLPPPSSLPLQLPHPFCTDRGGGRWEPSHPGVPAHSFSP